MLSAIPRKRLFFPNLVMILHSSHENKTPMDTEVEIGIEIETEIVNDFATEIGKGIEKEIENDETIVQIGTEVQEGTLDRYSIYCAYRTF